jgi:hypothetical protein
MSEYNASDPRSIRRAARAAKAEESQSSSVIASLMSAPSGRSYIYRLLEKCHIFSSSFSTSPLSTAFAEGERNVGLQILGDLMRFVPDQYLQMIREAHDRSSTDVRRSGDSPSNGREPSAEPAGNGSAGVLTDYDPIAEYDRASED